MPDTATDILPFRATETTLANGLRVIIVPTGFPHLVSLQIPVQTGSRNEVEEGKSGFAHFFEHMMFRGTKRFSADEYQAIVTRTGARQNAYTTDDYTNYHITFAKEDLETILDLEADRFMNLDYSEPDFRTEARAVLGEYNKSSANPIMKLIEVQRERAFTTHTYKHTTMGFIADIEAMPEQFAYSRTFFERWYRPEYTTVILAGDLEPESAIALVEQYWGQWRAGVSTDVAIPQEPEPAAPVVAHVPWESPTLPFVTVGFHGPAFSATDPQYAALDLLLDLSFGETSAIYQDLVEQRQLVDQLFVYGDGHQDPGLFTVFARVKRPEDTVAVRDRMLEAVAEARSAPPSAERVAEGKSNARYSFARTLDNSESIAATLARFVRYERSYDTLNALYRTYAAVTPGDLHAAARAFLRDERLVLTTLAHGELPAALAVAPAIPASIPASATPSYAAIELPTPSTLLRFKLLFASGSAHDPTGKEGLAALTADMIAEGGSERMRIDEINQALFPLAGSFSAQVDKEMTVFTGVIHRDNVDRFLGIALPQLTNPGFRDEDFARLREQQRNALIQDVRSNNEEELGKERLQENIFAGTTYAHPVLGTVAALDAMTLNDVRAFGVEHYGQAGLTLGVTGDWPEAAHTSLRAALGKLPAALATIGTPVRVARKPGIDVEIIRKETRATAISFGHALDVTRTHPDFAALSVARSWLGEHRASNGRLFQQLRELRGLNYGNYAYIEAFPRGMHQFFPDANLGRQQQIFEVWIRPVAPEHGLFALKAGLYELRRLIANGLSEEEFETTRGYLLKNLYVMTKTQDQQLGYALDSHWYGMGDYVETMQAALKRLTRDDVNAAILRHLSGDDLSVVMVTKDADGLRGELLANAFTPIVYESEKPPALLEEDQAIGALALGLSEDRVRVVDVEAVFAG